jgi:hypothetical protein
MLISPGGWTDFGPSLERSNEIAASVVACNHGNRIDSHACKFKQLILDACHFCHIVLQS